MTKYVIQVKKDPLMKEETKAYPQTSPIIPINLTSRRKIIFLTRCKSIFSKELDLSYKIILRECTARLFLLHS